MKKERELKYTKPFGPKVTREQWEFMKSEFLREFPQPYMQQGCLKQPIPMVGWEKRALEKYRQQQESMAGPRVLVEEKSEEGGDGHEGQEGCLPQAQEAQG